MIVKVSELAALVGKKASWHGCKEIVFHVVVQDVRHNYGRTDALIVPVYGHGSKWVELISLKFDGS